MVTAGELRVKLCVCMGGELACCGTGKSLACCQTEHPSGCGEPREED